MKSRYTYLMMGQLGFRPDPLIGRLRAIGISREDSVALKTQIRKWILCNGITWTIDHLKKIRQSYLNYFSGSGIKPPWIKLTKKGIPMGTFARLNAYSRKVTIFATGIYKVFQLAEITESQRDKFMDAVRTPDPTLPKRSFDLILYGLPKGITKLTTYTKPLRVAELSADKVDSQGKNRTFYCAATARSEKWDISRVIEDSVDLVCNASIHGKLQKVIYPVGVPPIIKPYSGFNVGARPGKSLPGRPTIPDGVAALKAHHENRVRGPKSLGYGAMGCLGATQEPGGKLRVFASPHPVYQCILEPLKVLLGDILRKIPQDSSFGNEENVALIKRALSQRKMVYSIDLSNATDTFPFSIQMNWLSRLSVEKYYVDLLRTISKGTYLPSKAMVSAGFPDRVKWSCGQPLGLGPSFYLFTLTHHFLMRGLCRELGLVDFPYTIHGDDVVIWDDNLATAYYRELAILGCQVSPSKTITSRFIAEFDGMIIDKDSAYHTTKHKDITEENVRDYAVQYGPTSTLGIDLPRDSRVIPVMDEIPDVVGGFGWNTSNRSLDQRLEDDQVRSVFLQMTAVPEEDPIGLAKETVGREQLKEVIPPWGWRDPDYGSDHVDTRNKGVEAVESSPQWKVRQEWIARAEGSKSSNTAPSHRAQRDRKRKLSWWERVQSFLGFPV